MIHLNLPDGWQVEVDDTITRRWYAGAPVWDCDCGHCRNFVALAQRRQLPTDLLTLLDKLGVPPEKATYVCEVCPENGQLLYQAGYRLAGQILARPDDWQNPKPNAWGFYGCSPERWEPSEASDFPDPGFDLDLWLQLPWILDEPM